MSEGLPDRSFFKARSVNMIQNEHQYKITHTKLLELERSLAALETNLDNLNTNP
jgi:hypothetical protein